MIKIRLTSPAEADLTDAISWYSKIQDELPRRFLDEFEHLLVRMAANPKQFPRLDGETRRAGFDRFPYALIFRIHRGGTSIEEVEVVACFHDRRDPTRWLSRT